MGVGLSKGRSQLNLMSEKQSCFSVTEEYMNDDAVAKMMARRGSLDLQYLQQLSCRTHFSYQEIELMYTSFRKECRSGEFSKEQFRMVYSGLHPAGDSEEYSALVFRAFDTNGSGSVDFDEFVCGLSSSCRGSVQEKLDFSFRVHDTNCDGYVTKEEMVAVVCALCEMLDVKVLSGSCTVKEHVDRLFDVLDADGDGCLSIDDFLSACRLKNKHSYDWVTTSLLCHILL